MAFAAVLMILSTYVLSINNNSVKATSWVDMVFRVKLH